MYNIVAGVLSIAMLTAMPAHAWTVERGPGETTTLIERGKAPARSTPGAPTPTAALRITCGPQAGIVVEDRAAFLMPDETTIPYVVDSAMPRRIRVAMKGAVVTIDSTEVKGLLQRLASAREVRFELVPDPKAGQVTFDVSGLRQLLLAHAEVCRGLL
jgi:hypothetical protein